MAQTSYWGCAEVVMLYVSSVLSVVRAFHQCGNLRRGGKLAAEHTTTGKLAAWATSLYPRHLGQKAGVGRENPSV